MDHRVLTVFLSLCSSGLFVENSESLTDPVDVRLVGGASRCHGALQVKHLDQWRDVVMSEWILKTGVFFCRRLDCGSVISAERRSVSDRSVWKVSSSCVQSTSSLRECVSSDDSSSRFLYSLTCSDSVRLLQGPRLCSGSLEVHWDQSWTSVCEEDFDLQDAEVVCRELGCGAPSLLQGALYGEGLAPLGQTFQCEGHESALMNCTRSSSVNTCSSEKAVDLTCSEPIRLVGQSSRCAGTVEVRHRGEWRPVTDWSWYWDLEATAAVCRDLDCGAAVSGEKRNDFLMRPVWKLSGLCVKQTPAVRECVEETDSSLTSGLEVVCSGLTNMNICEKANRDQDEICGVGTCENVEGSYLCQCPKGYTNYGNKRTPCSDVDECKEKEELCGKNAMCFNTNGSFYCQCFQGFFNIRGDVNFTFNGDCQDINECIENKDVCGRAASCSNLLGSYRCTCLFGYINSNVSGHCIDIDECEVKLDQDKICGVGTCENVEGSYLCQCPKGYTNYRNKRTPCSELNCSSVVPEPSPSQSLRGLAVIFSTMRNSCLALSDPSSDDEGKTNGEALLETLFTATESILSPGQQLLSSEDLSVLLQTVEDSLRFIGPQLNHSTRRETTETEAEIAVQKGNTRPTGPVSLTNQNARLDTDWATVSGTGFYPGFAMAAVLSYKNLDKNGKQSFEELKGHEKHGMAPAFQINSKLVTVVVSNPSTQNLSPPVSITLTHTRVNEESETLKYVCAHWNDRGAWDTHGCRQQRSNATHTVCQSEHLSTFAVLMALYPMEHTLGLQLLTKIGLTISLLCLILCIFTFTFCQSIKSTRTTIHLHLCICLFVADLVFLAGISQTQPVGGCRFVAALLHYFFLGVFTWMLLEGVQLYRMLVLVFNATMRPLYMYIVGYGMPLVIVIISAVIRPTGYGTDQYCWLSLKEGLIWSFFGPVCVIIIVNICFFIITLWKLAQKFASLNPDLSHLHKIRAFTVTAMAQMCILGLMWVFGAFLFQEAASSAVAYIFTVLNSLQGALILIMHCLLSKQVREEYAHIFSCFCPSQKKRYSGVSSSTNPSSSRSQGQKWTGRDRPEILSPMGRPA